MEIKIESNINEFIKKLQKTIDETEKFSNKINNAIKHQLKLKAARHFIIKMYRYHIRAKRFKNWWEFMTLTCSIQIAIAQLRAALYYIESDKKIKGKIIEYEFIDKKKKDLLNKIKKAVKDGI